MLDRRTQAVELEVLRNVDGRGAGCCVVTVADQELLRHEAELVLTLHAEVQDSRPIHAERELFRTSFRLDHPRTEVPVPESALRCYSYEGSRIRMRVRAKVVIDDGIFFDSKAEAQQELPLPDRPAVRTNAEEMLDPKDAFDFVTNFQAIAPHRRGFVAVLLILGAIVLGINTWVGIHDQLSPDGLTYFYSHVDSDGDAQSPFFNSLALSGGAGAFLWMLIRAQLKLYMRFKLRRNRSLRRDTVVPASALVHGVARCDLENATVRVVAANREKGQFKRGSGTDERTVSFSTPVRAVLLYERHLRHVPAGSPIESHLDGDVRFEPMFAALYPPLLVGSDHGIDVVWEVQLLHPELVDQELVGSSQGLRYQEFLEA